MQLLLLLFFLIILLLMSIALAIAIATTITWIVTIIAIVPWRSFVTSTRRAISSWQPLRAYSLIIRAA